MNTNMKHFSIHIYRKKNLIFDRRIYLLLFSFLLQKRSFSFHRLHSSAASAPCVTPLPSDYPNAILGAVIRRFCEILGSSLPGVTHRVNKIDTTTSCGPAPRSTSFNSSPRPHAIPVSFRFYPQFEHCN